MEVVGSNATIASTSVGASSFDVVIAPNGSAVQIKASNRNQMSIALASGASDYTSSSVCNDGTSQISVTPGTATSTITVTPSSSLCGGTTINNSSGGSGGGGGGGGGGAGLAGPSPSTPSKATPPEAAKSETPKASGLFSAEFGLGAEGSDVVALQDFLIGKGFLIMPQGVAKGTFGAKTKAALAAYQASKGISKTGYVGPKTLASLNADMGSAAPAGTQQTGAASGSFERDLKLGMTGDDVKALQVYLNAKGFTVAENGPGSMGNETMKFGNATRAALIKFQMEVGISPASGYFGPKTREYVNTHP